MTVLVPILVGALLVSCGGSSSSGKGYQSPMEMRDALARTGRPCADFSQAAGNDNAQQSVDQQANCTIGGEKTALITFKDAAQQRDWEAQEQVVYCGLAKALNQQTISWVHGSKWAVSPIKATNGKTIADAIGGRVKTIQC